MKTKKPKTITQKWERFSKKICDYHNFPNGCELLLEYRPNDQYPRGRKVRNDYLIKRKVLSTTNKIPDSSTVSDMISNYVLPLFVDNVVESNMKITLVGPNREKFTGNKQIANIKKIPGQPTENELEENDRIEFEIDEICGSVERSIREDERGERGLYNPEDVIPRAYMRALLKKYNTDAIKEALEIEEGHLAS